MASGELGRAVPKTAEDLKPQLANSRWVLGSEANIENGQTVVVFQKITYEERTLEKGLQGVVQELDEEDGDILVKWSDGEEMWVLQENLDDVKIKVKPAVPAGAVASVPVAYLSSSSSSSSRRLRAPSSPSSSSLTSSSLYISPVSKSDAGSRVVPQHVAASLRSSPNPPLGSPVTGDGEQSQTRPARKAVNLSAPPLGPTDSVVFDPVAGEGEQAPTRPLRKAINLSAPPLRPTDSIASSLSALSNWGSQSSGGHSSHASIDIEELRRLLDAQAEEDAKTQAVRSKLNNYLDSLIGDGRGDLDNHLTPEPKFVHCRTTFNEMAFLPERREFWDGRKPFSKHMHVGRDFIGCNGLRFAKSELEDEDLHEFVITGDADDHGITCTVDSRNRTYVSEVMPSQKQIWVNDEVLTINGILASDMDWSALQLALSQRPARITVARRGLVPIAVSVQQAEEAARKAYKGMLTENVTAALGRVMYQADSPAEPPSKLLEGMADAAIKLRTRHRVTEDPHIIEKLRAKGQWQPPPKQKPRAIVKSIRAFKTPGANRNPLANNKPHRNEPPRAKEVTPLEREQNEAMADSALRRQLVLFPERVFEPLSRSSSSSSRRLVSVSTPSFTSGSRSSSSSSRRLVSVAATEREHLIVGELYEVVEEFVCFPGEDNEYTIRKGLVGKCLEVDEDGDAGFEFEASLGQKWIFKGDQHNLKRQAAEGEDIAVGVHYEVVKDIVCFPGEDNEYTIQKGLVGKCVEVDEDGDAGFEFEASLGHKWIFKGDQRNLKRQAAEGEDLVVGEHYEAVKDIVCFPGEDNEYTIQKGLVGKCVEVDEDGDAGFEFEASLGHKWIFKGDQHNLKRQAAGGEDLVVGEHYEVVKDIVCFPGEDNEYIIQSGLVGKCVEVDEDGDAGFDFDASLGLKWIFKEDQHNLKLQR